MFKCMKGELNDNNKKIADNINKWALSYFKDDLKNRPSLHKYISTFPPNIIKEINKIRYSKQIYKNICTQFKKCNIIPLDNVDELYISHFNKDKGGDQGLFDTHYDGSLRLFNNATVVRALIYLSSSGSLKVVFHDCKKKYSFKTYDYGLLDFHRELHHVEGTYDSNEKIPRILLKCNYYLCDDCNSIYSDFVKQLNILIFYIVKTSMEYSKSPKTITQKIIGFFCNFFREINLFNPILAMIIGILLFIFIILLIFYFIKYIINILFNNKKKRKKS